MAHGTRFRVWPQKIIDTSELMCYYYRVSNLRYKKKNVVFMKPAFSEPYKKDPSCEIRLGIASWDDGTNTHQSVKYTWFGKDGKACRGGEFPVEALPQALGFAIQKGYIHLG